MKDKIKITKENYKEIVLKRAIITCWVLLIICFVVKICGGNFFKIICTNDKFIAFCNSIANSILLYIISYISFIFSSVILLFIVNGGGKVFTVKNLLFILLITVVWILKLLITLNIICINEILQNILELIILYLLLVCFSRKYLKSLLVVFLTFIFSLISAVVKNIGITGNIMESNVIAYIFLIDYYIMLILTLLYSIKIKSKEG